MSKKQEKYVVYGHDLTAICVQKDNNFYHIDSNVSGQKANYKYKINNGETTLKEFDVNTDRTPGYWKITSTFDELENVVCVHNKAKQIKEGKMSDETIEICLPEEYTLVIEKVEA